MKSVFVILGLLVCIKAAGSRAQTPVFVLTGEDLHLEDKISFLYYIFRVTLQWKFNERDVLVTFPPDKEPTVSDRYRGRVDVSVGSFSVTLKNLQKSDSGVYNVQMITADKNQIMAEYFVTVEDPVSPVKLTVDSVTNSSDPCDLTVTCRSLDSHQISISTTVTCNTTTCSQQGGERSKVTTSGATLQFDLLNDTLICDHSNQVSRTNGSIVVDPSLCVPPPGPESLSAGVSLCLVKTVVFSVALIIMVAAVISVNVMEKLKRK